jgi:SprT-like family protein
VFRALQLIPDLGGFGAPSDAPRPAATRVVRRATRRADESHLRRLSERYTYYNLRHFDGALRPVPVRFSRRLRRRLGYYRLATPGGGGAREIVISYRHLRRHGWHEVFETLLHEMIHQWQDQTGLPVDHGGRFRAKARELGVLPRARRPV